ncbi:hypothetical protein F3B35_03725 [Bacteroides intestinalis]|uniref:Uncharacterized protein n=1 Tax=Bacteroides intestinalis TaxID=329854 RepID=A0A3E4INZ4_9BACE|nr:MULTISPECIES: type II toxin-antitoxin system YoeB family toxin [Bacteroides]KAA4689149.1 hypothetical protein F3B37_17635 [Bacteroides intestinalis]KAA4722440.1 hypothetical protein F3B35_03725 [Bacteroides intestinalis]MBS5494793.1 type II toxin-antitoxin system YoeB family toxin [Bacteroides intestinalis]RGJ58682.1 hypothetical protein DXD57_02515 [Bacteroides intestinalis]RGK23024.1 hypothetical protein DXD27_14620 [Bacteroides intestinalis]
MKTTLYAHCFFRNVIQIWQCKRVANSEHRIIYSVHEDTIEIYVFSMRYHYTKK